MTDKLPPQLLQLFAPRPPLRWVPPSDHSAGERKTAEISSVADFMPALQEYKNIDDHKPTESWLQRRDRKRQEHEADEQKKLADIPFTFKPNEDPNIRGDAFKTLIVARLSYDANEEDLEREFARFGTIERIRIIKDTHAHEKGTNKKRKPHRGYAFVVFDREKDMRAALEACDGIRIKDRRIKVDVERGRTVKGWKPRRLGGGLGGRGYTKSMPSMPMGGGGRGGFGGGFRGGFQPGFRGRDRGGFRGGGRFGGGDRGGYGGGDRGGYGGGDRGFGGDRGGGGGYGQRGDRGPSGQQNGFGGPPSGPGGYGQRDNRRDFSSSRGGYDSRDGGRSYDDRSGGGGYRDNRRQQTGSNMEPIRPRGENGGYRGDRDNRDFDRPRDDDSRKRGYDGGYEDPRKLRRY